MDKRVNTISLEGTNRLYVQETLLDFSGPRASFDYDYNQMAIYMRLAEFYLNYAEIQIALGDEDIARQYINMVTKKAICQYAGYNQYGR